MNAMGASTLTDLVANGTHEFKVVIAYDEFNMGIQAKRFVDWMTPRLGNSCELDLHVWSFAELEETNRCQRAVSDAAEAHMIIVSLRQDNGVPDHIHEWIETWLWRRADPEGALVLLIAPARRKDVAVVPTLLYLFGLAFRSNMKVFTHMALEDECPANSPATVADAGSAPSGDRATS